MNNRKRWNKKGMLGNIIGAFLVISVGMMMFGQVSQQIDNMINCNITNDTNYTNESYQQPIGSTNSFGGGGSGQFGGYDGQVHKSWGSQFALIKTNQTNLNCSSSMMAIQGAPAEILKGVPLFFILAILFIAVSMVLRTFRDSGHY